MEDAPRRTKKRCPRGTCNTSGGESSRCKRTPNEMILHRYARRGQLPRRENGGFSMSVSTARAPFVMIPLELLNDHGLHGGVLRLWAVLKQHARQRNIAYPGQKRLAKLCGCSERSIRTYTGVLVAQGLVKVIRRGRMKTNVYILAPSPESERQTLPPKKRQDGQQTTTTKRGLHNSDNRTFLGRSWAEMQAHARDSLPLIAALRRGTGPPRRQ